MNGILESITRGNMIVINNNIKLNVEEEAKTNSKIDEYMHVIEEVIRNIWVVAALDALIDNKFLAIY